MKRTLEITTRVGCPHGCHFCPQKELVGEYRGEPSVLQHTRFIEVERKLPLDVEIHFSGFVEPYANRDVCLMLVASKALARHVELYTTLMGATPGAFALLKLFPPDYIRIHVPDQKGLIVPDEKWIDQHKEFHATELPASYMTMGKLTPKVRDYLLNLGIVVEQPDMLSRGGNLWQPGKIEGPLICSMDRWHQNVMLPNGDVYLCCMDYSLTTRLGNLFEQTYEEIHATAEQWRTASEPPAMCRQCEWAKAL